MILFRRYGRTAWCILAVISLVAVAAVTGASRHPAYAAPEPGAPTITAVTGYTDGSGSVTVAFAPGPAGDTPDIDYTASCGSSSAISTGSPITVGGLTLGQSYTCTVTARNAFGLSAPSGPSQNFTPVGLPGAPTITSVTPASGSLTVSFSTGASGGSAILDHTANCGGTSVTSTSTSITVGGLTNGTTYSCTVTTRTAQGSSPPSASATGTPVGLPGAPTITSVTPASGSLTVSFSTGASGGSAILDHTANCGGTSVTSTSTSITVGGLTNGTTYSCTVTTRTAQGSSPPSSPATGTPAGPPGAPTITSARATAVGQITVVFTPGITNGAATTFVAKCGARSAASSTATTRVVTGFDDGVKVTCTVTATNSAGSSVSIPSAEVTTWDVPPVPTGVTLGTPVNQAVTVNFTPVVVPTGGAPIVGYIARCSGGGVTHLSPLNLGTPIVVTGLTNGIAYTCSVRARNAVGNSDFSAAVGPVIPATSPGRPSDLSAQRGNRTITLSFAPPADNGGSAIVSYDASCVSTNGGTTGSIAATSSPLTVPGLTNGKIYVCTVLARNALGTGAPSEQSAALIPATVPDRPFDVSARPSVASAVVRWSTPNDGGSPITTFRITATPGDLTVDVSGATDQATVTGLQNGVAYTFKVTAINEVGAGSSSAATPPIRPNLLDVAGNVISAAANGYWFTTVDGKVATFGGATNYGGLTSKVGGWVIDIDPTPSMMGYWLTGTDGAVYAFGDAPDYGSLKGRVLNKPITAMAATPTGKGYWLVATDGGIFAFGDAQFFGSTGDITLNEPIVGMSPTSSGRGYWLVASDGGIFAFGDAQFYGSTGGITLNKPIKGMDRFESGNGYWLVASDGGVFAFGDAPFYGSTGDLKLHGPIIGMSATPTGKGYWFVAADAGVFAFGDAPFWGPALGANSYFKDHPVAAMAGSRASG